MMHTTQKTSSTNSQPYKDIRLFENPYLEKLTHVHPITPLLIWAPILTFLYWYGATRLGFSLGLQALLSVSGFITWTFSEYWLHRLVFHFKPRGKFSERFVYLMHGNHHDEPNDPTRLVMPPVPALVLGVLFFSLFWFTLGDQYSLPFFAGFILGYLTYDYTHFSIHHFTPRTRWGERVKRYHMVHHFVDHEAKWGVSSPFWDIVFGTTELRKDKSK